MKGIDGSNYEKIFSGFIGIAYDVGNYRSVCGYSAGGRSDI